MRYIKFFCLLLVVTWILSCAEEEAIVSSSDRVYTYHAPQMYNRAVFVYDSVNDTLGRLSENMGSFDKSSEDIADTLNYMIRKEFESSMIYSYELTDGEVLMTFGRLRLDSTDIKRDSFIFEGVLREPRNDMGNQLLPGVFFENFNREIIVCNDFFFVRGRVIMSNSDFYGYVKQTCESLVDSEAVKGFLNTIPGITVDTISIEQVNYVYISY